MCTRDKPEYGYEPEPVERQPKPVQPSKHLEALDRLFGPDTGDTTNTNRVDTAMAMYLRMRNALEDLGIRTICTATFLKGVDSGSVEIKFTPNSFEKFVNSLEDHRNKIQGS